MFWSPLISLLLIISSASFWSAALGQAGGGGGGELPSNIDYNTSTVIYGSYSIEGKVFSPEKATKEFFVNTKVIVNYGQYLGFVKADASFQVTNLPPGSYVVEISNAKYFYEPVRVDISSKGKVRARKVNYMHASEVKQVNYPLRFKAKAQLKYFQTRETWRVTDFLFNPMILMMVVPLLLLLVLPKMINTNDAETQKELQNLPKMDMSDMPDMSQMFTNIFGGGAKPQPPPAASRGPKTIKKK